LVCQPQLFLMQMNGMYYCTSLFSKRGAAAAAAAAADDDDD